MKDVSYVRAKDSLPAVAIALMQNLSPTDVAALQADLDGLKGKSLPDNTLCLLLGLKITNMVSTAVLSAAKASLGDAILTDDGMAARALKIAQARDEREGIDPTDIDYDVVIVGDDEDRHAVVKGRWVGTEELPKEPPEEPPEFSSSADESFASAALPQTPQTPDRSEPERPK